MRRILKALAVIATMTAAVAVIVAGVFAFSVTGNYWFLAPVLLVCILLMAG